MQISSRTPEGTPNRCPICRHALRLEPSIDTRDAPCPFCGQLLWFKPKYKKTNNQETYEGFILRTGKKRLGTNPVHLVGSIFKIVAKLVRQKRLPDPEDLFVLVGTAKNWQAVIDKLDPRRPRRWHWAYAAGAFLRQQFERLFANSRYFATGV